MENGLQLSERAWKMLKSKPRDLTGQPQTVAEIESLLERDNAPLNHPVIMFQLAFGGYLLNANKVAERPDYELLLGFTDISSTYHKGGHWFCTIAETKDPAVGWDVILMDETGALYCDSNIPFASSVTILIESLALEKEIEKFFGPTIYGMGGLGQLKISYKNIPILKTEVEKLGLVEVREASDGYEQWWVGNDCYIHVFRFWWSNDSFVIIMAKSANRLKEISHIFTNITVLPNHYILKRDDKLYVGWLSKNNSLAEVDWPYPEQSPYGYFGYKELPLCRIMNLHGRATSFKKLVDDLETKQMMEQPNK